MGVELYGELVIDVDDSGRKGEEMGLGVILEGYKSTVELMKKGSRVSLVI